MTNSGNSKFLPAATTTITWQYNLHIGSSPIHKETLPHKLLFLLKAIFNTQFQNYQSKLILYYEMLLLYALFMEFILPQSNEYSLSNMDGNYINWAYFD